MRKLTKILIGFLFAILLSASWVDRTEAQNLGNVGLVTSSQAAAISVLGVGSSFALTQNNASGHVIQYKWNTSSFVCSFNLDGSQDGVNWSALASGESLSSSALQFIYANGFYVFLRVKYNPQNNSNCNGTTLTIRYTGYAVPLPLTGLSTPTTSSSIAAPQSMESTIVHPYVLAGFQCFNPNASTAFLQIADASSAPSLGTFIVYQVGIPAGASFVYSGPGIVETNRLWLGASTTAGGSTAVATGLVCTVQTNFGPFYPQSPDDSP